MRSRFFYAALAVVVAGCGKSDPVVATVEGVALTRQELADFLVRKPFVTVENARGRRWDARVPSKEPLGYQAMRDLINRQLLLQMANAEGLAPTDADIDAEMEFQSRNDPGFEGRLSAMGMTGEQIRNDLEIDLIQEALTLKASPVSDDELAAYVKANPDEFRTPGQVQVRHILVDTEAQKKAVDSDLAAGGNFAEVARKRSLAPNASEDGGFLPEGPLTMFVPELREAIEKTPEGGTSPWIQEGGRWVRFLVQKRTPAGAIAMDEKAKRQLRRRLSDERTPPEKRLSVRLAKALKDAKIRVEDPAYAPLWLEGMRSNGG